MGKETQQILLTFVFIFAACTFGLFTLSTVGQRWYSCRPTTGNTRKKNQFDLIFTLWEYCKRQENGKFVCYNIDDAPNLHEVFLDFKVLRAMLVSCDVFSGLLLLLSIFHCFVQHRKICRRLVILQCVTSVMTVGFGLSSLVYGAARAQDIVGLEVRFTYGWSCVMGWIATIIAFLNAIISLVLVCVYLDNLTERMVNVREELGMDNISIHSETLRQLDALETIPDNEPPRGRSPSAQVHDSELPCTGLTVEEAYDKPPCTQSTVEEAYREPPCTQSTVEEAYDKPPCTHSTVEEAYDEPPCTQSTVEEAYDEPPCTQSTVEEAFDEPPCTPLTVEEAYDKPPCTQSTVEEAYDEPSCAQPIVEEAYNEPPFTESTGEKKNIVTEENRILDPSKYSTCEENAHESVTIRTFKQEISNSSTPICKHDAIDPTGAIVIFKQELPEASTLNTGRDTVGCADVILESE